MQTITIFIYSQLLPVYELTSISCINARCKRRLFDIKGQVVWISNSGLPYQSIPASSAYFEHMCHSCKTMYHVWFQ